MSETTRKTRRRRRPRRKAKPKTPSTSASAKQSGEAGATANRRESKAKRSRRPRRSRKTPPSTPRDSGSSDVILHQYDSLDKEVKALNKNIFIYTYTLRPRSLLDSYQAGPAVAERMQYEGEEQK